MSPITAEATTAPSRAELHRTLAGAGRACCCPARPVVLVLVPPAPGRPNAADLLLCGHHYRASRVALEAVSAAVLDSRSAAPDAPASAGMSGRPDLGFAFPQNPSETDKEDI